MEVDVSFHCNILGKKWRIHIPMVALTAYLGVEQSCVFHFSKITVCYRNTKDTIHTVCVILEENVTIRLSPKLTDTDQCC